jgi:Domain of unknown function (DUF4157)
MNRSRFPTVSSLARASRRRLLGAVLGRQTLLRRSGSQWLESLGVPARTAGPRIIRSSGVNPSLPDPQVALHPARVEKPVLPRLSDAEWLTPNPAESIREDSSLVIASDSNGVLLETDQDVELFNPETPNWTPEEAQQLLEMEQRLDALETEAVEPYADANDLPATNSDTLEVPTIELSAELNLSAPQVDDITAIDNSKTDVFANSKLEVASDHQSHQNEQPALVVENNPSDLGPSVIQARQVPVLDQDAIQARQVPVLDQDAIQARMAHQVPDYEQEARQVPVLDQEGADLGVSDPARVDGLGQDDSVIALPLPEPTQPKTESETRSVSQNDARLGAETSSLQAIEQFNQDVGSPEPDQTLERSVSVDPTVQLGESLPITDLETVSGAPNMPDLNDQDQPSVPTVTDFHDVSESSKLRDLLEPSDLDQPMQTSLEHSKLAEPSSSQVTDLSAVKNVETESLSSVPADSVSQTDVAAIQKTAVDRSASPIQAEPNPEPVVPPQIPSQSAPTIMLQDARDEIPKRSEDLPSSLDQAESVQSESVSTIDVIAEKLEQVFPLRPDVSVDSSVATVEAVSEVASVQKDSDGEAMAQSSELEVSSTSEQIALEQSTPISEQDVFETEDARVMERLGEFEGSPVSEVPTSQDLPEVPKIDQPQQSDSAIAARATEDDIAAKHQTEAERLQSVTSSELELPLDRDSRVVEVIRPRYPRPQRAQPLEDVQPNAVEPEAVPESVASENTVLDQNVIDQMFKAWPKPGDRVANPEPVRTERASPVQSKNLENAALDQSRIPGLSEAIVQESDANESVSQSEVSSKQDSDDAVLADVNDPLLEVLFKVWARPTDRFENASLPSSESGNDPIASQSENAGVNASDDSREVRNVPADAPSVPRRDRRVVRPRAEQMVTPADLNAEVEPLPEATRRFLKPVVGIDPNEVRLHRGMIADELTDDHNADAVTVGEDVFISSQASHDPLAQLGLLAHEFTHVARNRQARFVPSTVKSPFEPASSDEETIALGVERQARAQVQLETGADDSVASSGSESRDWRGLPAPWEPMPDFGQAFKSTPGPSAEASVTSFVPNYAPGFAPNTSATSNLVQAAERGRDLEPVQQSADTEQASSGSAEPNLDALANQIYTILKRRLQTETRRGF